MSPDGFSPQSYTCHLGLPYLSFSEMYPATDSLPLPNFPLMKKSLFCSSVLCGFHRLVTKKIPVDLPLFGVILMLSVGSAWAEGSSIDFETSGETLPGWSATVNGGGNQGGEYRLANKWDKPMNFALDGEKPHGGSLSFRCEVTEDIAGVLNFASPPLEASGPVQIRFFVRSVGVNSEGSISLDEVDPSGRRLRGKWAGAKIPLSEEWTEVVWTETLGENATGLRVRFAFKDVPAGAKIWVDDVQVTPAEN
jgi:hypothetical protein